MAHQNTLVSELSILLRREIIGIWVFVFRCAVPSKTYISQTLKQAINIRRMLLRVNRGKAKACK